ncbi:MAG: UDP-N-acetylmuramoyl-L-alanine--D-glutamate ligase [Bacteroidetes bacterium]|nr:UDP-N-acetylmuramoyl-L-alanine--D-glutamate ligase [Bacteroidota bacterium]
MNKQRIVILGAGESGVGSAILAKSKNFDVFVSDNGSIKQKYKDTLIEYNIEWEEGGHSENLIFNADLIIKSPGIPDSVPVVKKIIEKKIKIISEIEFAGVYTNAKMICITGSNGKTTTTLMIYHLLKKAGFNVGVAGNIGKSFALQVAQNSFDYYVIELSSFQLDGIYEFKPDIAIIMNITPDHLNRYDNVFQNYVNSKFRITQNLTLNDYLIYCSDDEVVINGLNSRNINTNILPFSFSNKESNGAYVENNNIIINMAKSNFIMSIQDLALQGKHNTYNSMAAGLSGKVLKIRKEIIRESLSDFQGVEHRLEPVIKVHGIEFINDSKATNVNSTWYALETMTKPIVWIVGGIDKGNDYSILSELVRNKVKAIVCLGKDNQKIHKAFADFSEIIVDTYSIEEAVSASYYLAEKGEVVLLSPSCASFDLFENYEDRGRKFKNSVRDL